MLLLLRVQVGLTYLGGMPSPNRPFDEIHRRLLRAARNGERLHLELEHVQAIVASPLYLELTQLVQAEIVATWPPADSGTLVATSPRARPERPRCRQKDPELTPEMQALVFDAEAEVAFDAVRRGIAESNLKQRQARLREP